MLLKPRKAFSSVTKITPEFLKAYGIKALLLDLDNTLTTHNNPVPAEGILSWLKEMKSAGILLMIVSNNKAKRVVPFAEVLELPYESRGMKPLPAGFIRAMKRLGLEKSEIGVVGDQLYTDILGANLGGFFGIFVTPMKLEDSFFFKIKRALERPFLPKGVE